MAGYKPRKKEGGKEGGREKGTESGKKAGNHGEATGNHDKIAGIHGEVIVTHGEDAKIHCEDVAETSPPETAELASLVSPVPMTSWCYLLQLASLEAVGMNQGVVGGHRAGETPGVGAFRGGRTLSLSDGSFF